MPSWSRVATRSRVPLGFVFAAAYVWFARPTWTSLGAGFAVAAVGVLVRALASGHISKNAALATTGPYAYTRNPLYLGSIIIAVGFLIAARNVWIGVAVLAMFAFIYLPVITAEEKYLRSAFPAYDRYASEVPRFLPRLTPYQAGAAADDGTSQFSSALYLRHREYNAALGSILMLGALVLKMLVKH
ncbi:MAG TPA: isoprenylcysteine carboxylmethyltransferase family protein [Candidatus Dormibacteraeota bacterium]|jgi:protein-S-isoprenylcysteine O-methyltransferase Ste14|nr:isoprenylcysteine carboxylmethyltransferase family protein [Candidatus Dormibacteraeota bacterium]